jgi:hypothetical protein
MADEAARMNMSTGLKNSLSIIPKVQSFVQFAVNEECVVGKECAQYRQFLAKGKPVFHIEYTKSTISNSRNNMISYKDPNASTKKYCNPLRELPSRFSTIIKAGETLSPSYLYCDGKPADATPVIAGSNGKAKKGKSNYYESEEGATDGAEDMDSGNEEGNQPWQQSRNSTFAARGPYRRFRRAV